MNLHLRESLQADLPFMEEMLYEAVFWRDSANRPSFAEAMAYPEVSKALVDWGNRAGDTAVMATVNSIPAGAALYRYWTDDNNINGYIDESMPVLVIAVHGDYRRLGIGKQLISRLLDLASEQAIPKISLSVSKDNHAVHLYRQQGFVEHTDRGDSFLMVREVKKQ